MSLYIIVILYMGIVGLSVKMGDYVCGEAFISLIIRAVHKYREKIQ